jgi:uncharacterized protein YecE (DUF72 family)
MLDYYCRQFPLVELNFTFYRPPTAGMLDRIAAQTPAGFQFLVKLPRTLSHDEDPKDLPGFRMAVERLGHELGAYRLAVEFRHRSWANREVTTWMAEHRLDLVSVDVPDLPNLYPRGLVQSSDRFYIRLHSRKAENWYASGAERYDYDYGNEELAEWASALADAAGRAKEAMVLFNNCAGGQAPANALKMRALMERLVPKPEIVEPIVVPTQTEGQQSLFE